MKKKLAMLLFVAAGLTTCFREAPENGAPAVSQSTVAQQVAMPLENQSRDVSVPAAAKTPIQYSLSVDPTVLPDGRVRIEVESNIPGTIEVMAEISLHGQAGEDIWVGKNDRLRLTNGRGVITFATHDLPKGKYDALASFYPRWGFKDATSRATGISEDLETSQMLVLGGSGESATAVQFRKNGQSWVMANVTMGDHWNGKVWTQQFGQYHELSLDRGNPDILKPYYFPRIDITLIVDVVENKIAVWRLGKAHS